MDRQKNRLTLMPFLTAFFAALAVLPALNIVKVNWRGLGIEIAQPWRKTCATLADAALRGARSILAQLRDGYRAMQNHALFRGAVIAGALALVLITRNVAYALPIVFGSLTEGQHAGEFICGERADGGSRENITVLSGQTLKAGAVIGRVTKGIGRISVPTVVTAGSSNGTVSGVFAGPEVQAGSYVATCTVAATNAGTFSLINPSGKALPNATVAVAYTSREINFTIADGSNDYIVGDTFTFVVDTTAPTVLGGTGTGTISALSLGPDAKTGRYQVIAIEAISNGGRWQVFGPDGTSIGEYLQTAGSGTATAFTNREINFTITDATDFIVGNSFEVTVFNQLHGGKVAAWDPTVFDGRHRAAGALYSAVDASGGDLAGVIVTRDAAFQTDALIWGAAITAAQQASAAVDLEARGIVIR